MVKEIKDLGGKAEALQLNTGSVKSFDLFIEKMKDVLSGSVVAFLCTDDAKWITGQRIEISGGMNL